MPAELKLIYVGDRIYHESGTVMSSLYTEDGDRSDWGKAQSWLRDGGTIAIRQATPREMANAYAQLADLKERQGDATPL